MTTRPGYVWDATASAWVEIGQAAVVSPFKYQASQPSSPATGDIWIDSDDDVPSVDSTLYYRWTKTMSGGETSLSGTDNNSLSLRYTPGYESVFINGVLQVRNLDYAATSGSTISGLTALASNDIVMVESIIAYSVGDTYTQSQMTSLLDAKSPVSTTGLVLITSATVGTAVSSVTVTGAFNATYDNYKVTYTGGTTSTSTVNLLMTLGATTTGYYSLRSGYRYAASAFDFVDANNGSSWFPSGAIGTNPNLNMEILQPNLAKITLFNSSWQSDTAIAFSAGYQSATTQFTAFTLTPQSGTLTGGTIKVYGYK